MFNKLGKKRGFTLVEVLVAFVIFAIMAAMVGVILQTTMRTRQQNAVDAEMIVEQKSDYYQKEHQMDKSQYGTLSSSSDSVKGVVELDFQDETGNSSSLSVNYVASDVNSTADVFELQYYLGEEGNNYWQLPGSSNGSSDSGKSGSVISGIKSTIYGSSGIDHVTVAMEQRGDNPNQYYVYLNVSSDDMTNNELDNFIQVRLKFPSTILKYGYINANGNDNNDGKKYNAAVDLAVSGDNQTMQFAGNGKDKSIYKLSTQKACCWVELATPLTQAQLQDMTKVFGDSGKTSVSSSTTTTFTTGNTVYRTEFNQYENDKQKYVNVFAVIPDTSTPTGDGG